MKILRATFLGVHGVPDGSYDLSGRPGAKHDTIAITGPAASGKTRFLESLLAAKEAIGPYGAVGGGASFLRAGASIAKVMLTFALDEAEQEYAGVTESVVEGEAAFLADGVMRDADEGLAALLSRYRHERAFGKVEYLPSSRRLAPLGPHHGTGELEQRLQRASKDATKYGFVNRFLRELPDRPEKRDEFAALLARLSPSVRYAEGDPSPGLPRVFKSRGGKPSTSAELSDTEQQGVLLAAVAVGVGLSSSIVLIDRPELGTAPGDAAAFVEGLRALGEGNQLVLATSAPEILAALAPENVIQLEVEG